MSLHGKKRLRKKDRKGWHCDKILVHFKKFVPKYEAYSFLDGYLGYHHIFIAHEDRYETTFVTDWGAFVWMVMPFGVKNGPPTF